MKTAKRSLALIKVCLALFSIALIDSSTIKAQSLSSAEESYLMRGVNLAGAEFGESALPGTYSYDYIYPNASELDYYKSKGLTLIRLPFRWERVQQSAFGALDANEIRRLDNFIAAARARSMQVILDPHNYARYYGRLICKEIACEAFTDFWMKLADHYKDEPAIYAYGLMNEPHDTQGFWYAAAQAGISGIRSVDTKRLILVSGDGWSSAYHWTDYNSDFNIMDVNFMYEAHQYFDADGSGNYNYGYDNDNAYPEIGTDRVKGFIEWLKNKKARGFIGEFGIPDNDQRWLIVLDNFLSYLDANCIGSAYWAGGPWWGNYPLSIEPRNGQDRPQMSIVKKHLSDLCRYELTIAKMGTGSGTVTSVPEGIRCGEDCQEKYPKDTDVTITAEPAGGSSFTGWSGACTGTGVSCQVTMDQAKTVTVTFVEDNSIFTNPRLFVMQQYRDFLHREGDPGGIDYWTQQLAGGAVDRATIADLFLTSPEFEGRVAPLVRLYLAYFLRLPDYSGLWYWVGQLSNGMSLPAISQAFADSAEFQQRYGALDCNAFLTLVYQNVLGRDPESEGLAYWQGQLCTGTMTRGDVMLAFAQSAEYQQRTGHQVLAVMLYVGLLQREPEPAGFDYWVRQLQAGMARRDVLSAFLNSPEYRQRFLP